MLGTEAYQLSYSSVPFQAATTLDELFTALVESVEDVELQYAQRKLSRLKKNFSPEETKVIQGHATATPLLYQLDSDISQFASFWPNEHERARIIEIFNRLPRGKKLPTSPLNSLHTKLSNSHQIIEYIADKYQIPLRIQRFYRYSNNYLYVSPSHYIHIRKGSVAEIILEQLFKNPEKPISNERLMRIVAKRLKIAYYTPEYDKIEGQIKSACRLINQKLSALDVEYKTTKDLILHDKDFTSIDLAMFRESYLKKTK